MDRSAFLRAMRTLERLHPVRDWSVDMTPFEVLVSTILSQSTTVANERRGMKGLLDAFGSVTPEVLAQADERAIAKAIWHAGLARQKAPRIREVARRIRSEWGGDMSRVLLGPVEEARAALTSLPGIGPKTADVVLAMAANRPVFPVDTHIARIAGRWKIGRGKSYEDIRRALEAWTPPGKRKAWHLALIAHGREVCKAQRPRCDVCPVSRDCDWYRTHPVRPRTDRKNSRVGGHRS
jgi:endonuclease III